MRIAIISGGSKGLGRELCLQLQELNYRVFEFSRSAPHPFSVPLDLEAPEQALKALRATLTSLDLSECTELLVFSNAGTLAPIGPAWRQSPKDLLANLNTNFTSAILVLAEVAHHFRDLPCRKVLINISSGAALKGYAGWSLYCAAKAGMESFIRSFAVEEQHQQHPFLSVSIDPGVIDTDMQALIRQTPSTDFPDVERFTQRKLDGGLASPKAVAAAIIKAVHSGELLPGGRHEA
jgi:benzil reductase ((S)-benzoin forming)